MKNNGKSLERLVKLIQEALKGRASIEVLSNHKMNDRNGGKREIDILVKSNVNEMDINIAIECKEHRNKKPVDINEVDSFKAKCDSIPEINKRIFVSISGYSAGAKRNADNYGISLYQISELTEAAIISWFPLVRQLRLQLKIVDVHYGFGLKTEEDLDTINVLKPQLYDNGALVSDSLHEVLLNEVNSRGRSFWDPALLAFMDNKINMLDGEGIVKECQMTFPTGYSLVEKDSGKHVPLNTVKIFVNLTLTETSPKIMTATAYGELGKEDTAQQLTIDIGHDTKAEIVRVANKKYEMFIRDEKGDLTQLSTLGVYDPKEKKLKRLL